MEIASKYEIAAANLAIALQTDTVSVEQRSELRAAIGSSIDKLVDALNMIIVCYNKRMYAGEIAPEKSRKVRQGRIRRHRPFQRGRIRLFLRGGRRVLHAQNPDGAVDR